MPPYGPSPQGCKSLARFARVADVAGLAIEVAAAFLADAAGAADPAAAVEVCLGAVGAVIEALVVDANQLQRVASQADAVSVDYAALGERASLAESAAAIGVGFDAVLAVIFTLRGDARERYRVTRKALTIRIGEAFLAGGAGGADAAAIDVSASAGDALMCRRADLAAIAIARVEARHAFARAVAYDATSGCAARCF